MGTCGSKSQIEPYKAQVKLLKHKIKLLQDEIKKMVVEKEKQNREHEGDMVVFAFREAEWKQEKQRLKTEIKRLTNLVEENEDRIREIELNKDKKCEWQLELEKMRDERAWRDEAVEKWKHLYLAIKTELDHLIHTTHLHGDEGGEEETMIEEMKMELEAKEEAIEALKTKLASMEKQEYKRAREVDILRQSLRIVAHNQNKKKKKMMKNKSTLQF